MSKSKFMTLEPRVQLESFALSSHSDHTKEPDGTFEGRTAKEWYEAYEALRAVYEQDTKQMQESLDAAVQLLEDMNTSAAQMEAEIRRLKKGKKKLSKKVKDAEREESSDADDAPAASIDTPFQHGIGYEFEFGKKPRMYDLSDPKGETPKTKVTGVKLEVQPGRGFRIDLQKK